MKQERMQKPDYYDEMFRSKWDIRHHFYNRKINFIIDLLPAIQHFLDAGCGSGVLAREVYSKKKCFVTGIDIREDQIHYARSICPSGQFFTQDLRKLDLSNQKFDAINCSDVIEHFYKDERMMIYNRFDQHLRASGSLIFVYPSWLYIKILEPIWKIIRNFIHKNTAFDDDVHLWVNPKEIEAHYTKRGYQKLAGGHLCLGLLVYRKFVKTN